LKQCLQVTGRQFVTSGQSLGGNRRRARMQRDIDNGTLRRDNKFISYLLRRVGGSFGATNDARGLPRPIMEFNYHNYGGDDA
jgi:hypothetical protein